MASASTRITYIGHATVLIEMNNTRILTDPILRNHLIHLARYSKPINRKQLQHIDAILISHIHMDHLDFPSLKFFPKDTWIIIPKGAGKLLMKKGVTNTTELTVGESLTINSLKVTSTKAQHDGYRFKYGISAETLGYIIEGEKKIYFPGDTEVFPEMSELENIDIVLMPVWGWGPTLGKGHMDPEQAAQALKLIKPKIAIPIHWGSLYPVFLKTILPRFLVEPPELFASFAQKSAPEVSVKIINPGESLSI